MNIRPFLVTMLASLLALIFFVANGRGDVDPAMVGTWETSGVNANGPWKLTWQIRPDSSYFLSGAVSDSGIIGSGDGRWHTQSNVTKQLADGTYTITDTNHMLGTGPSGSGTWTRVTDKQVGSSRSTSSAQSGEGNPFENVFGGGSKPVSAAPELSRAEKDALMSDFFNAGRDAEARARLEAKARSGIAEAQVLLAMHFQSEKKFSQMLSWFRKAADQGNGQAMRNIGVTYRDGLGVSNDAGEAMAWFRKAWEAGGAGAGDAALDIANLYSEGTGVAKDGGAAADWYRKSADRGNAEAMNFLGASYWNGVGVEKNAGEAISWWKQAAEKGDESAKKNLEMALKKFDEFGQPRTRK